MLTMRAGTRRRVALLLRALGATGGDRRGGRGREWLRVPRRAAPRRNARRLGRRHQRRDTDGRDSRSRDPPPADAARSCARTGAVSCHLRDEVSCLRHPGRARHRSQTRRAPRPRRRRHAAQPRPRRGDVRAEGPKGRADGEHILAPGQRYLRAPDGPPGRRTHLRDIVSAATTARARRSDSSCSSTSPARRRSPSESAPTRSIAFSAKSSGLPRTRSTITEARSINTSATRS